MKNTKTHMSLRVGALLIAGILIGVTASARAAWTNPTATPPSGNIDAPINTGSSAQGRTGALSVGKASPTSGVTFDVVGKAAFNTGGVAIGKASPSTGINLDVTGSAVIDTIGVVNMIVATGTPAAGKILTSADSVGTVSWQAPSISITPVTYGPYNSWANPISAPRVDILGSHTFCALSEFFTRNGEYGYAKVWKDGSTWKLTHAYMDSPGASAICF